MGEADNAGSRQPPEKECLRDNPQDAVLRLTGSFDPPALASALGLQLLKSARRGEKWWPRRKTVLEHDHANVLLAAPFKGDADLQTLKAAVDGLSPSDRAIWDGLELRKIDIAVFVEPGRFTSSIRFSSDALSLLAGLRVTLELSAYESLEDGADESRSWVEDGKG